MLWIILKIPKICFFWFGWISFSYWAMVDWTGSVWAPLAWGYGTGYFKKWYDFRKGVKGTNFISTNWGNMLFVFSSTEYPFRLFLLLFVSSNLFCGIHGSKNEQEILASKLVVLNHEFCQSCPERCWHLFWIEIWSSGLTPFFFHRLCKRSCHHK